MFFAAHDSLPAITAPSSALGVAVSVVNVVEVVSVVAVVTVVVTQAPARV